MNEEMAASGWCRRCQRWHRLGYGNSLINARQLIERLQRNHALAADSTADASLATDSLFAPGGGKMFGVLTCVNGQGQEVTLRAFSGQHNGLFTAPGWSPPLFPVEEYQLMTTEADNRIKELEAQMTSLTTTGSHRDGRLEQYLKQLCQERRALSRALMPRLHALYRLRNQRGETASLFQAWTGPGGIPTGAGDCCAPKLLCQAAEQGLTPLGMCEFFFGDSGQGAAARRHLGIYPACAAKCQPLLGFLLCGLDAAPP